MEPRLLFAVKYGETDLPLRMAFADAAEDDRKVPISLIVYLIVTPTRRILVDAGCDTMPGFDLRLHISPAEAVHGATGFLQAGDVMVLASRGGSTKELFPIMDICHAKGVKIITVTENMESPLAKGADVVLKQHVNRETDKYNMQGTTSTTALCMIFHALQSALVEETDYHAEQFALIHPGGAVGERLNKK